MPTDTLLSFQLAARNCAAVMMESAKYIRREIPNVLATPTQKTLVSKICETLVGNWFDIQSELGELIEIALPDFSPTIRMRVDRIDSWLAGDFPAIHQAVETLASDAERDQAYGPMYILFAESATNILHFYALVSDAHEKYIYSYEHSSGA